MAESGGFDRLADLIQASGETTNERLRHVEAELQRTRDNIHDLRASLLVMSERVRPDLQTKLQTLEHDVEVLKDWRAHLLEQKEEKAQTWSSRSWAIILLGLGLLTNLAVEISRFFFGF